MAYMQPNSWVKTWGQVKGLCATRSLLFTRKVIKGGQKSELAP
jgi:hypothetical protein